MVGTTGLLVLPSTLLLQALHGLWPETVSSSSRSLLVMSETAFWLFERGDLLSPFEHGLQGQRQDMGDREKEECLCCLLYFYFLGEEKGRERTLSLHIWPDDPQPRRGEMPTSLL